MPHPSVEAAAQVLIDRISSSPELRPSFSEGKMLGVLVCEDGTVLNAFSGLAGGRSIIPGFVPPIFDWADPEGIFRSREAEISQLTSRIESAPEDERKALEKERRQMSVDLQAWLFDQYRVMNAKGESSTIAEIFAGRGLVPPGGTGDCAAPKLLQHAFVNGLKPKAMGEFWYGASPLKEVREQARFYPSCTGKCGPLLTWMLQGLDVAPNPLDSDFLKSGEPTVIHVDDNIIIVDKPSGMLSVPGRTTSHSLLEWLRERYGVVESCHRLDMDTSGVMVFARNLPSKVELERQFAEREVRKTYRARLVGGSQPWRLPMHGTIALPLLLDYDDRPRQMVDYENGKLAVTEYEVVELLPDGEVDIRFIPHTGRSHQLRVHSAHSKGLGRPIKGDCLYGSPSDGPLFLRAESLSFRHPVTGESLSFAV